MKEIKLSLYTPLTNLIEVKKWTKLPIADCKINRIPGFYLEVKQI
jgi:hypothetical protein